jgi:hypothetical protein
LEGLISLSLVILHRAPTETCAPPTHPARLELAKVAVIPAVVIVIVLPRSNRSVLPEKDSARPITRRRVDSPSKHVVVRGLDVLPGRFEQQVDRVEL